MLYLRISSMKFTRNTCIYITSATATCSDNYQVSVSMLASPHEVHTESAEHCLSPASQVLPTLLGFPYQLMDFSSFSTVPGLPFYPLHSCWLQFLPLPKSLLIAFTPPLLLQLLLIPWSRRGTGHTVSLPASSRLSFASLSAITVSCSKT